MDYLIGINRKFLFTLTDISKVNIFDETDEITFYDNKKKLVFFCNKIDCDFLTQWQEGEEIPETLTKIYGAAEIEGPEGVTPEPAVVEEEAEEPQ